jgi:hypothetical protein
MPITEINLHGIEPENIGIGDLTQFGGKVVALRVGAISVYISDLAVVDALHEATTRAYELLAETVVAS